MDISKILSKDYEVPQNVPGKTSYRYIKAINNDWCKYFEIITLAGGIVMQSQLSKLILLITNKEYTEQSLKVITSKLIKEMKEEKFIEVNKLNKYNYITLKRPAIAFTTNDYKKTTSYLSKSKKDKLGNYNFKLSIAKIEYLINYNKVISNKNLLNQLRGITRYYVSILNKFNIKSKYDIRTLKELCEVNTINKGVRLILSKNEKLNNIGIIRDLWTVVGKMYESLQKHNQTVILKPYFFKFNINHNNYDFTMDFIPEIFIYDIDNDIEYYKNKIIWFNRNITRFRNISNKETMRLYSDLEDSKRINSSSYNRIGFKITIIGGYDEYYLKRKVKEVSSYISGEISKGNIMHVLSFNYRTIDSKRYFKYNNFINPLKNKHDVRIQNEINVKLKLVNGENLVENNLDELKVKFVNEFKNKYKTCMKERNILVRVPSMNTLEIARGVFGNHIDDVVKALKLEDVDITDKLLHDVLNK